MRRDNSTQRLAQTHQEVVKPPALVGRFQSWSMAPVCVCCHVWVLMPECIHIASTKQQPLKGLPLFLQPCGRDKCMLVCSAIVSSCSGLKRLARTAHDLYHVYMDAPVPSSSRLKEFMLCLQSDDGSRLLSCSLRHHAP